MALHDVIVLHAALARAVRGASVLLEVRQRVEHDALGIAVDLEPEVLSGAGAGSGGGDGRGGGAEEGGGEGDLHGGDCRFGWYVLYYLYLVRWRADYAESK